MAIRANDAKPNVLTAFQVRPSGATHAAEGSLTSKLPLAFHFAPRTI
jgi:hypothetical protein